MRTWRREAGTIERRGDEPAAEELNTVGQSMIESARGSQSVGRAQIVEREVELYVRLHRGKMITGQTAALERQFIDRAIIEFETLPHLRLYWMHSRRSCGEGLAAS